MRSNDAMLFAGFGASPSLPEVAGAAAAVAQLAAETLRSGNEAAVVLSGAGTSGRLAMCIARSYNRQLARCGLAPCFHYLIAGGERALFAAAELAEDEAGKAVEDLVSLERQHRGGRGWSRVLYVGITCGLSATYVGAQLEYALKTPHYAAVLVGFNPVERARKVKMADWGRSFFDLALDVVARQRQSASEEARFGAQGRRAPAYVLTPVVGPESVQGSTRLKGGTATRILLDSIFAAAVASVAFVPLAGASPSSGAAPVAEACSVGLKQAFAAFEGAASAAYSHVDRLAQVVRMAADARAAGGSVVYVGGGGAGLVGMVDASEQVPTFGAHERDFRACLAGGWVGIRQHPPTHKKPRRRQRRASVSGEMGGKAVGSAEAGAAAEGRPPRPPTQVQRARTADAATEAAATEAAAAAAPARSWFGGLVRTSSLPVQSSVDAKAAEEAASVIRRGSNSNSGAARSQSDVVRREFSAARSASLQKLPIVAAEAFVVAASGLGKLGKDDLLVIVGGGNGRLELTDDVPADVISEVLDARQRQGFKLAVFAPEVAAHDRVVCLASDRSGKEAVGDDMDSLGAPLPVAKTMASALAAADVVVPLTLPPAAAAPLLPAVDSLAEVALKMALNVVSTGAHVLIGKVYGSRMIDVRVSNDKLLHRAGGIVAELASCSQEAAHRSVLRAVHELDADTAVDGKLSLPSAEHVHVAIAKERVVPTAVLLAMGVCGTVAEAHAELGAHPTVRAAVAHAQSRAAAKSQRT